MKRLDSVAGREAYNEFAHQRHESIIRRLPIYVRQLRPLELQAEIDFDKWERRIMDRKKLEEMKAQLKRAHDAFKELEAEFSGDHLGDSRAAQQGRKRSNFNREADGMAAMAKKLKF